MCNVCYGIGNCPVCGRGSDEEEAYFDELQNYLADKADNDNDERRINDDND